MTKPITKGLIKLTDFEGWETLAQEVFLSFERKMKLTNFWED